MKEELRENSYKTCHHFRMTAALMEELMVKIAASTKVSNVRVYLEIGDRTIKCLAFSGLFRI